MRWAVVVLLLFLGTFAGQSPAAEKVQLRYLSWETSYEQIVLVKKIIAAFEAQHPNIKIQLEATTEAPRIFLTDAAAGTPADVMYITNEFLPRLVDKQILLPLDDFITSDGVDLGMFLPRTVDFMRLDGKLYAYPIHFSTDALFYNKKLFDERGVPYPDESWTWETFRDAATSLTVDRNGDGNPEVFGCLTVESQVLMASFGARVFDEQTNRFVEPPPREAIEAVRFNLSLLGKQAPTAAQAMDTTDMQMFANDRLAMFLGRTWQLPQIAKTMRSPWDVAPIPKGRQRFCILAVGGNCIAAGSRHPREAWEFVKFYSSLEGQKLLGLQKNCTPALRELALSKDYFLSPPPEHIRVFVDAIDYAGQVLPDRIWAREFFSSIWQPTLERLRVDSKITPEQALADIARQGNLLIDKYAQEKAEEESATRDAHPTDFLIRFMLALMILGALAIAWLARSNRRYWEGYLFIGLWLIGFVLFTLGPVLASLYLSFCRYDLLSPPRWIGLANILDLIHDPLFWKSLGNTLYYCVFTVPATLILSLFLAMLLNTRVPGTYTFRAIYYLPALTAGVAISLLWRWIYNPQLGLMNTFLGYLGIQGPEWLGSPTWAMPAIIIMSVWGGLGGPMLIYLAGLQGIPQQLYEAAAIDGASRWQAFRHVTLPMLSPSIFFNLIMAIIGSFQVFTTVFVMTANTAASAEPGGPANSTMVYVLYLYQTGFRYLAMGKACAMAWILFLIILGLTLWNYRMSQRWVHYDQA
ncbi:MAG: extracellular solute-binding protein [Candidatus Hydrogenedentota bacterium]|jgi:multiple sugar transport system permease protein|uniref:N-Acetyl-D-glucosamine ABC transport system, permease protein 1 n=1 Tax=Sumerlaea chitinivorans TaxID=2250252 RepID=A0A2Z4Y6N1_SUMC1|nr:N-Acetyl-D-glucosamine ABC transport system, permease protein 1 [Candidatus Sumerlaea chitinivorans]MCX7963776.1 extracellular solute-binding protein [Candidatus Sumerlaea chitinivorans]RMH25554.1 MAG: extracellular solute-binding protein [Candidatus Hydrogenedentota bacterium]